MAKRLRKTLKESYSEDDDVAPFNENERELLSIEKRFDWDVSHGEDMLDSEWKDYLRQLKEGFDD